MRTYRPWINAYFRKLRIGHRVMEKRFSKRLALGFFWDSSEFFLSYSWEFRGLFVDFSWAFPGIFLDFSWAGLEFGRENSWYYPPVGAGHRLFTDEIMELIVVRRCWNLRMDEGGWFHNLRGRCNPIRARLNEHLRLG
jgi:hypothetical protein